MVFVNLDKKPVVAKKGAALQAEKKCMNCGSVLYDPAAGGIDGRRFCSQDCKDAYLGLK